MKTADVFRKVPRIVLKRFISDLEQEGRSKSERLRTLAMSLIANIDRDYFERELVIAEMPENYDQKLLSKDLHDLLERLIAFLGKEELAKNPVQDSLMKLKACNRYDLTEIANSIYKESLQNIDRLNIVDNDMVLDTYALRKMKYSEKNNLIGRSIINPSIDLLTKINRDFYQYAIAFKVEYLKLCQFINSSSKSLQVEAILPKLDFNIIENQYPNKIIQVYQSINLFLEDKEVELGKVQGIVNELQSIPNLSKPEFETILTGLRNVLVRQGNQGKREFNKLHLDLHKLAIERSHYNDRFNTNLYRNIILYACREKEYDWALEFSNEYRFKLPEDEQETAYSFNKARIYQNMASYEKVVETLRDVEYKDITYNLNSKLMLIASFYELDEYEPLISTIRAFKVFLRRRRNISVKRKANFNDFCDALYNIIMAEEKRDQKRIAKAREIIAANPAIPNNTWLEQKIDLLKIK